MAAPQEIQSNPREFLRAANFVVISSNRKPLFTKHKSDLSRRLSAETNPHTTNFPDVCGRKLAHTHASVTRPCKFLAYTLSNP